MWTTQATEEPIYSESSPSYQSIPEEDPASVPQQDPASAAQAGIDSDLVGHWRYTDILMSGDFTLVTDYHIIFNADGTSASYYQGSKDEEIQDYIEGAWSATDTVINFASADGTTESHGYQIYDGTLIFDGNSNQFWDFVGP